MPFIYGIVLGYILVVMDTLLKQSSPGVRQSYFWVLGFIFIYYLSQASLFRSAFGYGGFFYFAIWLISIKTEKE